MLCQPLQFKLFSLEFFLELFFQAFLGPTSHFGRLPLLLFVFFLRSLLYGLKRKLQFADANAAVIIFPIINVFNMHKSEWFHCNTC